MFVFGRETLPLLVCGQRVVPFEIAERGLRAAERVRRRGRSFATRVDADLHAALAHRDSQPGVVFPRLAPEPLGIATELPCTGVALAHGSSSSCAGSSHAGAGNASAPTAS